MQDRATPPSGIRLSATTTPSVIEGGLGLVFFVAASLLLLKNVNIVSPIMAHDEFAYFSQAREFPDVAKLQTYDPTSIRTHNVVYFWLGHLFW